MTLRSADTLFHFTNSARNLIRILTDEFLPHFSLEDLGAIFSEAPKPTMIALPMVCFCDIRLSQATEHMQNYGNYTIGMSKEWGIKNGVTPVLYTHSGSPTTATLSSLLPLEDTRRGPVHTQLSRLAAFCKPYEGLLERPGKTTKTVRFYDEREWRFVPVNENLQIPAIFERTYRDFKKRDQEESNLSHHKLSFSPSDIRYLIVNSEREILPLIDNIREIKDKYGADELDLLCSRITSAELIAADF